MAQVGILSESIAHRPVFYFPGRKLRPVKQKRFAGLVMGWKRILSQKRPAAGGEAREILFRVFLSCFLQFPVET